MNANGLYNGADSGVFNGTTNYIVNGVGSGVAPDFETSTKQIVRSGLILYVDAANPLCYRRSGSTPMDLINNNFATMLNYSTFSSSNPFFSSLNGGAFKVNTDPNNVSNNIFWFNGASDVPLVGSYTVETVVRLSSLTGGRGIFSYSNASPFNDQNFALTFGQYGSQKFALSTSANSNAAAISTSTVLVNTWYHVTGVYDSVARTISIFVNAKREGVTTLTQNPSTTNAYFLELGSVAQTLLLQGLISIARIYNRVLTQSEINQNFNATRRRFNII